VVAANGLLQRLPRRRYQSAHKLPDGKVRWTVEQIRAWARDRKVGFRGHTLFWFEPTRLLWRTCGERWCSRPHGRGVDGKLEHLVPDGHHRQADRLCQRDIAFWNTLLETVQLEHMMTFQS
jgi:hypothetical protein